MANTSDYKFTDEAKSYRQPGFYPTEKGGEILLIYDKDKTFKGVQAFGAHCGIITEDDLTNDVCEFLLSRKNPDGKLLFAHLLVKKDVEDAKKESKNKS